MEKITIHRALAELKLIDSKTVKAIQEIVPVGIYQKGNGKVNGVSAQEDFKKSAESKYQSVTDLIARKIKIKAAIVASNGSTSVTIGNQTMTVADAITAKELNKVKQVFIDSLKAQQKNVLANLNRNNDVVNNNIQVILEKSFGKDNVKAGKDDIEAIRKPFMDANEWLLFDPLSLSEKISSLDSELEEFQSEVDSVLSESNAVTFIEI